jgi:hypothetical protein
VEAESTGDVAVVSMGAAVWIGVLVTLIGSSDEVWSCKGGRGRLLK